MEATTEYVPKTIGIVGSRRRISYLDFQDCRAEFDKIYRIGDRIVSGGCPTGGDQFAEVIAKSRGLTITIHYPDWDRLGKCAGFERNTKIAKDCDVLIAVVASDRTGGVEDTIKKAIALGKQVICI